MNLTMNLTKYWVIYLSNYFKKACCAQGHAAGGQIFSMGNYPPPILHADPLLNLYSVVDLHGGLEGGSWLGHLTRKNPSPI